MDTNNPFETFEHTAFRLEALPQYLVEGEAEDFDRFTSSGVVPSRPNPEWARLVKRNIESGKTMKRLRLISDELSPYERFELQTYPGILFGEAIRVNARAKYLDKYDGDFWFFDDTYIGRMNYADDGTFNAMEVKEATEEDKNALQWWLTVFESSTPLESDPSDRIIRN